MATREFQSEHDWMVLCVANHFSVCGYADVCADVWNYDKPEIVVRGEIRDRPDASARAGKVLIVAEVETADTICDAHTEAQWPLFADHVRERGGSFWLVVPSGTERAAEERLRHLGIGAEIKVVPR